MAFGPIIDKWISDWRENVNDALIPSAFLTELFGVETSDSTIGELTDEQVAELMIYELTMGEVQRNQTIAELYAKTQSLENALVAQHNQLANRATRRANQKRK